MAGSIRLSDWLKPKLFFFRNHQKILMYKSAERKKSQMNLEEMLLYCHAAA
jgi:hypothetical protein